MKPIACLLLVALFVPCALWSADADPSVQGMGFHFKNVGPLEVLESYRHVLGTNGPPIEYVTSLSARSRMSWPRFDLDTNFTGPPAEIARLLDCALAERTGIVLTPLGDRRVSVTFNDAIPIPKPVPTTPQERAVLAKSQSSYVPAPPAVRVGADTLTITLYNPPDPKVETIIRWTDLAGYSVSEGNLVLTLKDGTKHELPRKSWVNVSPPELLGPILETKGVSKK